MASFQYHFQKLRARLAGGWFFRPRRPAQWFAGAVAGTLGALLLVGAFVFAVNPYHLYGVALCKPAYIGAHAYQMLPGLLKREAYDTVAVASCMGQNFRISEMEAIPGWGRAIKATAGGASMKSLARFIEAALDTGRASHIFLLLDTPLAAGDGVFNLDDQVLDYLYDGTIWNDYKYFLNWDVLTEAVPRTLRANLGSKRFKHTLDRDRMFFWDFGDRPDRYGDDAVRGGFTRWRKALDSVQENPGEKARFVQDATETRFLATIRARPDIRFTIVYAPYSSAFWYTLRANGALEPFLAARTGIQRQLIALPNVELHEFQGAADIVANPAHFSDPWHYNASINSWMLDAIRRGGHRLTSEADILEAADAVREISRPGHQSAWLLELLPPTEDAP